MKIISPIALAFCAVLAVASQTSRPASAQPANPVPPVPQLSIISSRADENAEPLLTLRASDSSVAALLSAVSAKTGVKIIINADAPLDEVDIKRMALSEAIAQIVELANLKLSVEPPANLAPLADRIYIVKRADAGDTPNGRLDMEFKSIVVAQIVELLSEQFAIKAKVKANTPEISLDIYMSNTSALEALQTIADAAGLEINKTAEGYLLQERSLAFKEVPAATLFQALAQQFGVEVRLAPNLSDKLIDVDLTNLTPVEAMNAAAKAADFEVSEVNGVYIVRERAVVAQ